MDTNRILEIVIGGIVVALVIKYIVNKKEEGGI